MCLALVEAGVLRGLSLEFQATTERWEGNLRTIEAAKLSGVAVVDRAAYSDSAPSQVAKRHQPMQEFVKVPLIWL